MIMSTVNSGPAQWHGDFYKHQCCDSISEERHLRDWDFGNKGPEPTCSFFANYQCYDVSQEEIDFNNKILGTTTRVFHDHQPHSDFHEPDPGNDFDFVSKVCGQRRHSVQNHQAYSNFWEQFPTKDFGFVNRSRGQKRQPSHNCHEYSPHGDFQDQLPVQSSNYCNTGGFQRQKPVCQDCSHDEMNLEDLEYTDETSEHTLGPLCDHSNVDFSEKMPLEKCVNRGHGPRLSPFQKFQKQMQLRNFHFNNGTGPRQISYCDNQPSDPPEQILLEDLDFEQGTSLQRLRSFQDHPPPDNINPDWYLDK